MKRTHVWAWLLVVGVATACLTGCLGKTPSVERYLRVRLTPAPCQDASVGQRAPLGFKTFRALENLDNTAVLTAQGPVLTPSLHFYWEGAPQEIVSQLVRQAIECRSGQFSPVDYQPRVTHDGVLTGQVTAFNVQETSGGRFVVGLHLDLWTKNRRTKVATGDFSAYAPLDNFRGATVANAASEAMGQIVPKILTWLDGNRAVLDKDNRIQIRRQERRK